MCVCTGNVGASVQGRNAYSTAMSFPCSGQPAFEGPFSTSLPPHSAKQRIEAEDAQRLLLAALNGLAGLQLLAGRPEEAAATYRGVLAAAVEFNGGHEFSPVFRAAAGALIQALA